MLACTGDIAPQITARNNHTNSTNPSFHNQTLVHGQATSCRLKFEDSLNSALASVYSVLTDFKRWFCVQHKNSKNIKIHKSYENEILLFRK